MRIHLFWDSLVQTSILPGPHICIGSNLEGLSAFLEVFGSLCVTDSSEFKFQQNSDLASTAMPQLSLFDETAKTVWEYCDLDSLKGKNKIEALRKKIDSHSDQVFWIACEKLESIQGWECPVYKVALPSQIQWESFLKKVLPLFQGEILLPQSYYEAAEFLKSLWLTGEYGGEAQSQLNGSAWEKLEYLWHRELIAPLSLSDLMHVAYCLETIHKKISFPDKAQLYVPSFFMRQLNASTSKSLIRQGTSTLVRLLTAIHKVDPEEGTSALAHWIFLFQSLSAAKAP